MSNYNNFLFYGSWRETLEGFREDFGDTYAREALWNLMLMATAGDIETDKKSIIGFVQGACMPNIEAAQDRYERAQRGGQKGGRPKLLSTLDEETIASLRKEGRTAVQIGEILGVSEKTIRRSTGWKEYKTLLAQADKTDKTDTKTQNPEKDIDIDKDIEKDKEKANSSGQNQNGQNQSSFDYLYDEILSDGFLEKKGTWIDEMDKGFYEKSRSAQCSFLENIGYTAPEANFILENILGDDNDE